MTCPEMDGAPDSEDADDGEDLDFEIGFYEAILNDLPDSVDVLTALGNNYTRQGFHEKGLAIDMRLCQLRPSDPVVHYNLACSYSLLARLDESLEALQQTIVLGYDDFAHMQRDPDLERVRNDPRYALFLERILRGELTS